MAGVLCYYNGMETNIFWLVIASVMLMMIGVSVYTVEIGNGFIQACLFCFAVDKLK